MKMRIKKSMALTHMKITLSLTTLGLLGCVAARATDSLDNWAVRGSDLPDVELHTIAYGDGRYVALDSSGQIALTSTNGLTWLQFAGPSTDAQGVVNALTYGAGRFVAVGANGLIGTSTDGAYWTKQPSGTLANVIDVAYGNGGFVAVVFDPPSGPSPAILASSDGTNWIVSLTNSYGGFGAIAYGNGQFVAMAESGAIATSVDGVNWAEHGPGNTYSPRSVAYGEGRFVAVRGDASCCPTPFLILCTSTDGVTWTENPQTLGYSNSRHVVYGNGRFVMVRPAPTLLTSTDGMNWYYRQSGSSNQLWGIAYGNGRFVAVGDHGTILESAPIVNMSLTPDSLTGLLSLASEGPTGLGYTIQSSSDLAAWQTVTNFTSIQPGTIILNVRPNAGDKLFYRAYTQ